MNRNICHILLLVSLFGVAQKNETISKLTKGGAYYREKGVEHNVFNNNSYPYSFIEVEIIK